jgi:hypothetical protein
VASTALLTFYRVCAKRGSLLANVAGIVVHDHWKPYYTMQGVLHALCNAHHLREFKALVEIKKEDWARKMQQLLQRACLRRISCANGVLRSADQQEYADVPRRRSRPRPGQDARLILRQRRATS